MAEFPSKDIDGGGVEERFVLTLVELCRASGSDESQLLSLVDEGVLEPAGEGPGDWVFDAPSLRTARIALRLCKDLELSVAGAAVVLELLAQIDSLQTRLRRAGLG
jgi:chaperone modulatory protein CbpM